MKTLRKRLSFVLALILLLALAAPVAFAADGDMPFDVKPPQNVSVDWLKENDSPTTMALSFSIDNQMLQALTALDQARNTGL
ncbi:MAG: hypothetical protein J5531_00885, partial [Lachnospiraceae bacterium]|nr:hypothetical protein [Lachnospiraceae bacterium]